MANVGLGANRYPFHLIGITNHQDIPIYNTDTGQLIDNRVSYSIEDICENYKSDSKIRIDLVTPLRIRSEGSLLKRDLDMEILFRNLCRRLTSLLTFHENEPLDETEFHHFIATMNIPKITSSSVHWYELSRYSNRQQSKLGIGGLIGTIHISEVSEDNLVLLSAASHIHVGKGTVMGLGKIQWSLTEP